MSSKVSSCKFPARTHKGRACFSIPAEVQEKLGLPRHGRNRKVRLLVVGPTGRRFEGEKELRSGSEIYGKDINEAGIKKHQLITVVASRANGVGRAKEGQNIDPLPSEVDSELVVVEGGRTLVQVNRFERDPKARKACIEFFRTRCIVCGFDFRKTYGEIGVGFIHVHHLRPLAMRKKKHKIDPRKDLCPVCPNCHEMLHRRQPPFSIEELKAKLQTGPYR